MSEKFQLWMNGNKINKTIVYLLDGKDDHGIYKLTRRVLLKNNYYLSVPVFAVWIHGEDRLFTINYQHAARTWEEEKNS